MRRIRGRDDRCAAAAAAIEAAQIGLERAQAERQISESLLREHRPVSEKLRRIRERNHLAEAILATFRGR